MREQRTTLSRAVVEKRAHGEIETDDALTARYRALDFFPTPPWGARAIAEHIAMLETPLSLKSMAAWEPAAGEGHIAEPLREYFGNTQASDINDYGKGYAVLDFLGGDAGSHVDWVITNPPFLKAADFIRRGMMVARRGVAILARATFLESASRYELLFKGEASLSVYAPFCERIAMQLGSWDPKLSSATAYAWFIFQKHPHRETILGGRPAPIILPIPPGTKARLTRPDDARRFGVQSDQPLFNTQGEL